MPIEIDTIERRIMQLEIEREALKKETEQAAIERLEKLEKELADLREQSAELKTHWQNEKVIVQRIQDIKQQIEQARTDEAAAERRADLQKAAELRYGTIMNLQKELDEAGKKLAEVQKDKKMLKEEVDEKTSPRS